MVESEEDGDDDKGLDIVDAALRMVKSRRRGHHGIDFGKRSAPRLPFPRSRGHASVPPIVNSNFPMCHSTYRFLYPPVGSNPPR